MSSGDLAKAGKELDPNVLILESGGAERSAAEYLGGHARSDAEFLKTAHQQLRRRTAHASGDFAWVASESELHQQKDGKPVTVQVTPAGIGYRIVQGGAALAVKVLTPRAAHRGNGVSASASDFGSRASRDADRQE